MTKRERVLRTIAGKPCDHIPFSFWCHLPPEAKRGRAAVRAHAEFYRRTDVDFIKMMIDGYRDISQGFVIQTPEDWDRLPLPDMNSPFIREQVEMIKALIQEIHGEAPVIYHMFSPYSVVRMIWGHDIIAAHLHEKDARSHLLGALKRIACFQAEAADAYLRCSPADGLMLTVSGAEQDGIGRDLFEEVVRPGDFAVIQSVQKTGKLLMLHLCGWGKRPNQMEFWQDYPADVMDYDTEEDNVLPLAEAKQFFRRAKAIMGGFGCGPDSVLFSEDRETLRRHLRQCVSDGGILSYFVGAGSSFPPESADPEIFHRAGKLLREEWSI